MARTPKRVVERKLLQVPVLIEDTVSYSKYFEVARLDPNFHAGKNGFLIRGTQYLKNGTPIQVEVLDRYGKTIFSNVIGNYSEGDARLVSVEVTQKTRKGPGKLVVVGTATNYEDGRPIPIGQQNRPNVRWVFPIDIDPSRRNTSKLILQNTPARILNGLSVTRTDFNTTTRTDTFVTSSTYTASLDYDFEGHRSDGYAITMLDSASNATPFFDDVSIDGYFTGSLYKREISNLYDTGVLVPDSQSIVLDYVTASVYTPLFKTLNETLAITERSIKFNNGDDFLNPLLYSGSYSRSVTEDDLGGGLVRKLEEQITSSVIFEYPTETLTVSANNSSILNFRIPYTQTHTGEIAKVRISAKEANPEITAYQLLTEFSPGERNILVTGSNTGNVSIGRFLTDDRLQNYWQSGLVNITDYENSQSANPITLVTSSAEILEGFYADHTESAVSYYFGTQEFYQLYQGVQYTLKYDAVYNPTYVSSSTTYSTTDTGSVKAYLTRIGSDAASKASSSVVIATKQGVTNTYGLLVDEVNTKNNDKGLYERRVNFTPERDGVAYLRYIVDSGFWNFSNFVITPAVEYGYNPDEIVVYAEDTILTGTTYIFKIEFIGWAGDISDEFISDPIEVPPKGGGSSIRLITDRLVFSFASDGDPIPAQQSASVDVVLTNITSTPQFTLVDDDLVDVDIQYYSASNGNLNIELYHTAFGAQTQSINPDPTSSILLTVSASAGGDIFTDKIRFNRVKDATDGTPGEQGPTGAAGTDAKTVKLTLSDYSVVYAQGGVNPSPTSITASAQQQNLEAPVTYSFFRTGSFATSASFAAVPTTPVTYSFSTPTIDDYDSQLIRVEVTESATGIAFDTDDFFGVTPGLDGWTAILINEAHTIPAQSDGTPLDFGGSGADIEILYGGSNLLPWTGSAPPDGYFSASVFTSQSVNQPEKTGSVASLDGEPTYVRFGDIDFMEPTSKTGSITFKVTAYTSSYSSDFREFYLKQSFSKTNDGTDGVDGGRRFYIEPQNGRSFKTDGNGVTVPTELIFITKLSEADTVTPQVSSSAFGLFFSSSGDAVSGAPGSANYSASAADITGHDVLEFYSASVLVDTIDITDVTDGLDSLIPLLEVKGPIAWLSGSAGIDPDVVSQITASLYRTGSEAEYLYAAVDGFGRNEGALAKYGLTGSVFVSSSNNVSGSFVDEYVSAGGDVFNLGFSFFSGSSSPKRVAQESFVLTLDGKDGETGASGSDARTVRLNLSDYSIVYNEFGKDPSPTSVQATASVQNIVSQSAYFAWYTGSTDAELQTIVVDGVGIYTTSFALPNDLFNPKLVRVKVSESVDSTWAAEDSVNLYGVQAGQNAYTIILTNESHTFPASSSGEVTSFVGGGTDIEVLYGATNLLPYTGSAGMPVPIGYFSASVIDSGSVNQPDKTGSVADQGPPPNPTYVRFGDPDSMDIASNTGFITYEITAVTGSVGNREEIKFTKKQSFSKSKDGTDGFDGSPGIVFYIDPINGRSFKTDKDGNTVPSNLYFVTRRSSGSLVQDIPSGSFEGYQYGLFYSGSSEYVSGSVGSAYYTASYADILGHEVLEFRTGSDATITDRLLVDTIDITDVTDGLDAIIPLLDVDGPVAWLSGSAGIDPDIATKITGSLYKNGNEIEYVRALIDGFNIGEGSTYGLTGSVIVSSSVNVSASFTNLASGSLNNHYTAVGFSFFSGSASPKRVAQETFVITTDGVEGETGASGSNARTLRVNVNDYSIVYDEFGKDPNPTSIEATASVQNIVSQSAYFAWYTGSTEIELQTVVTEGIGIYTASFDMPFDVFNPKLIRVKVSESVDSTWAAEDSVNVYGIQAGINAYTIILTNDAHVFPATSDGVVTDFSEGGTQIEVLYGGNNLDPVVGPPTVGQFSASVIASSSVHQPDKTGTDTGLTYLEFADPTIMLTSATIGSITYEIAAVTGSASAPEIVKFTRKQSFSKSKAGVDAPIIKLILDGSTIFSSASGVITPSTDSDITGSLIENQTEYTVTASISPDATTALTPVGIGSGSNVVSGSWNQISADDYTYEFRFFSGSVGNYTQVAAQTYTIVREGVDGQDGTPGVTGSTGPGILYVGEFDAIGPNFVFKHTEISRDVVSVDGTYYYFLSGSATDPDLILDPPQSESLGNITASSASPTASNSSSYWREFEFFKAVATDMLLAQDIYTHRTINVGVTESLGGAAISPAITLYSDFPNSGSNPYLSIGQGATQGYGEEGIFLGSGSAAPKFSLSGSGGHLLWSGSLLTLSGDISASSGYFSGSLYAQDGNFDGTVLVGDDTVVIGQGTSPKSVSKIGFSNTPIDNKYDSNTSTNTFTVTEQTAATLVHGTDGSWVNGDSIEIHFRFFDIELSPPAYFVDEITDISFKIIQNGITTDIGPISESYQSNVNNFFNYTASYVANSETNIQVKYSAVVNLDANGPGTATSYYTSSVDGNYLTPSIAVSNRGIFFDRGNGEESILNLGLVGGGGSGGGGGSVNISGTPLDNQIAVWTNSNTIEGTSNFVIDNSGNVGIGTTSPKTKLDVEGAIVPTSVPAAGANPAESASLYLTNNDPDYGMVMGVLNVGDGYIQAQRTDGTATTYDLLLNPNGGNVGIGTTSPEQLLSLVDSAGELRIQMESSGTPRNNYIGITGHDNVVIAADEDALGGSSTIQFRIDADEKMRIKHTGNVGIGTTDPSSFKLQVSGDVGPNADATHDLGSSSLRWANIYTADFHLSNESSSPNSVDGTHGNWTIQEGEEYLYIINNKSGKKYRFMLEEIE